MAAKNFAAIILAAGYSSRMGKFKPMLPLGKTTVIEQTISVFQIKEISHIVVVVGHRKEELVPVLETKNVIPVENPDFHEGMFTSIMAGVSALTPETEAFFIMPVDMPLVNPATIKKIMVQYQKHPGHIIRPYFSGKAGHPPLIPSHLSEAILDYKGNGGLRKVLNKNTGQTVNIDVLDPYILFDMDRPADYNDALMH